ncbi:MAG: hypothetical protein K0S65_2802 [Labilithrix sp.]|nr:hypothetical protein [Labilithrix sp.]
MRQPFKTLTSTSMFTASVLVIVVTALASACSSETRAVDLGREPGQPGFTTPDGSAPDAATDGMLETRALCIATECPAPLATCGIGHKCATDLSHDPFNCGECGHECMHFPSLFITPTCAGGKCRYDCLYADVLDCNGLVEDGCEINRMTDPTNCGACGHVCPDGVSCISGECGCPAGLTACDGFCADLNNDNFNCKACGSECPYWANAGWPEPPPNMMYSCDQGECQHLTCVPGWGNCDGKLDNGCEVDLTRDPKNCAACGQECASGQVCGMLRDAKVPACLCNSGETLCGNGENEVYACADLLNDKNHCGACYNDCGARVFTTPNTFGECTQGRCSRTCLAGFADCDGDPSNGCEVNLNTDSSNCGACGQWCAASQGQPCIGGACLTVECDAGGGPTR